MEKIFPDTLAPSPEVKPKKKIRLKEVPKEIQIPDGCESIKTELNGLNSLPKNQFTESAYKVLSDKSTYTLKKVQAIGPPLP